MWGAEITTGLPTITTVLVTAAIDSINPCAIGVLVLLVSTLLATKRRDKMLKLGLIYIGVVYLVYFVAGLGLTAIVANMPVVLTEYIALSVGTIIVIAGLIEIKDFYWYGHGWSLAIAPAQAKKIHRMMQKMSVPTVIFLGAFVAAVELPCTGGPYLAITLLLAQNFDLIALLLLAIYNVIFVAPLLIILFLVIGGVKVQNIKKWKFKHRGKMRMATGVLLVLLGWMLILIANGSINLA